MKMQENLNIDFQIGFGFDINDYDDIIIGLVDDERWEDPFRSNFIYSLLPYFISITNNIYKYIKF